MNSASADCQPNHSCRCRDQDCSAILPDNALFCPVCGLITSYVTSDFFEDEAGTVLCEKVSDGRPFYLVARNHGQQEIRLEILDARARGLEFVKLPLKPRVRGGRSVAFQMRKVPGEPVSGMLEIRYQHASRGDRWWERAGWETVTIMSLMTRLPSVWSGPILGAGDIVFPHGVRIQPFRIWNPTANPLELSLSTTDGYSIQPRQLRIEPGRWQQVVISLQPGFDDASGLLFLNESRSASLMRLRSEAAVEEEVDLIVAIDYGTRNAGIRAYWCSNIANKRGTPPDPLGPRGNTLRFPSGMIARPNGTVEWGVDPATHSLLRSDEVLIDNLKTDLRLGINRYVEDNKNLTNERLLRGFFQHVLKAVDGYLIANGNLLRRDLKIRYVLTIPVLDSGEGDTGEQEAAYKSLLLQVLMSCDPGHILKEEVVFLSEPNAATLAIFKANADYLRTLDNDSLIAVVDCGGGTTDITFARIQFDGTGVIPNIVASTRLRKSEGAKDVEFGGNDLDQAILCALQTGARNLLTSENPLQYGPLPGDDLFEIANVHEGKLGYCRLVKEGFSQATQLYMGPRSDENQPPGGVVNALFSADALKGYHLEYHRYESDIVIPVMDPLVTSLSTELAATLPDYSPDQGVHVFYVGGSSIDPAVRKQLGALFGHDGEDGLSSEINGIRQNAVIEGAISLGNKLFATCSLTLNIQAEDRPPVQIFPSRRYERRLLPSKLIPPSPCEGYRQLTVTPGRELMVRLFASGPGLDKETEVMRGWHRNDNEESEQTLMLLVRLSQDHGCEAQLKCADTGNIFPLFEFHLTRVN